MSVLIIGSGKSANLYKQHKIKFRNFKIVVVNHGHLITPDWDIWVHSSDFTGTTPDKIQDKQTVIRDYSSALNQYGGIQECGFSIMLAASYWVLANLKPEIIYYLGADLNYTPDSNGSTHIYGVGLDIKKNGLPDPEKMAREHKAKNQTEDEYINQIYSRFQTIANNEGTDLYNLSDDPSSRLPYPKLSIDHLLQI